MTGGKLGSLTIDIAADVSRLRRNMGQAQRQISVSAEKIAQAATVAFAGVTAAVTAVTTETLRAAGEIDQLSRVANTSAEQFQRYAVGAQALGVEQEKLADIFKDTSDRVGDFLTTGGGPLADFFDTIAPQIGVTAEQFRNLSGPQALQLYVDTLEKANVTQNELVFFLEAISGDAAALIPLLKGGGEGFRAFADEAARAGAIIDDETLEASRNIKAELFIIEQQFDGLKNQISSAVIPVLGDLLEAFNNTEAGAADFANESTAVETTLRFIVSRAAAAAGAINLVAKSVGGLSAVFVALGRQDGEGFFSTAPLDRAANVAREFRADLDNTAQEYANLVERLESRAPVAGTGADRLAAIRAALAAPVDVPEAEASEPGGPSRAELFEQQKQAEKDLQDLLRRGQAIADSVRTDDEQFAASKAELDTLLQQNAISQETYNRKLLEYQDILGETQQREREALEAGLAQVEASLQTEEERIAESYQRRQEIVDQALADRLISEQRANDLTVELMTQQQEQIQQLQAAQAAVTLNNYQSLFGTLADVAGEFAGEQSGIYRALFAASKAFAIAESIVKIQQGLASAAAIPFPANIGAIASVAASTAGIISTIQSTQLSFEGGGFTGFGPRSGGLDGRGGFMAMLHPNETVIDHARGGSGAGSVVVNIQTQGEAIDRRSVQQIQQGVYRGLVRANSRNG